MSRTLIALAIVGWVGATLLLSEVRWFRRRALGDRLRPYVKGAAPAGGRRPAGFHVSSVREVLVPLCQATGGRVARAFGVQEALEIRLTRVHSPLDAAGFRMRQLGWSGAGLTAGLVVAAAARPPLAIGAFIVAGSPLLAFLIVEHRLSKASLAWQTRLTLELPVISEQLAMLLGAGYSLGAALNRIADRGEGACARDFARVCARIRHGLNEADALREWAEVAGVDAVDRLVPLLALSSDTSDLGRLVSEEARNIRRDVQRRTVATMERRGQQVWIPVTVATLVPGVILLAVPFIQALRLFSGS